jgi:hypothetical protein
MPAPKRGAGFCCLNYLTFEVNGIKTDMNKITLMRQTICLY